MQKVYLPSIGPVVQHPDDGVPVPIVMFVLVFELILCLARGSG